MRPQPRSAAVFAALALCAVTAPAPATTVDFETPDLGGASQQIIQPFAASGVVFTTNLTLGLVAECALSACGPCGNQLLGTALLPGCPIGSAAEVMRADFTAAAGPVTVVSAEYQTLSGSTLVLNLYDASDVLLATASAGVAPAYGACGSDGEMIDKGVVLAVAPQLVAYATLSVIPGWTCPGPPGCFAECNPFAIDDFTFLLDVIPARPASWGGLKITYR